MTSVPINSSEAFVQRVCRQTFLSLWCFANPQGKDGKELRDILVVCDPDVLIISVKDVRLGTEKEEHIESERWRRRAINASVKQLFGADRWLRSAPHVIRNEGSIGVALPSTEHRHTHPIAVAFGSRKEVSINGTRPSGTRQPNGFVHVMTERSFIELFTELDTIQDFVDYLRSKESFLAGKAGIILQGSESNLLGFYLHHGRSFPNRYDCLFIEDGIWEEMQSKPEFRARKAADVDSYAWDHLIESLAEDSGHLNSEFGLELTQREIVIRGMARENRFSRRILGAALQDFLNLAKQEVNPIRFRAMVSFSGALYVLVYFRKNADRRNRITELTGRCLVARNKVDEPIHTVMGIGFSEFDQKAGSTTD